MCGVERVGGMTREAQMQARVDKHERVRTHPRPKSHHVAGVGYKPKEDRYQGNMNEHKSAPCCLFGHLAQEVKEPPLPLVYRVEFVRQKRCKSQVKD